MEEPWKRWLEWRLSGRCESRRDIETVITNKNRLEITDLNRIYLEDGTLNVEL